MSGTTTPTFGVLSTGFVRKRLPDLITDISTAINANMAVVTGDPNFEIDLGANTVSGQTISIMAEQYAILWEVAEAVWNSAYPVTASGVSLDNAVSFSGVNRLQDTFSVVYAVLYGTEGTTVPTGSVATQSSTGLNFDLEAATTITANAALVAALAITTVASSATYTVTLNNVQYQVISQANATAVTIAQQLTTSLQNSGLTITQPNTSVIQVVGIGRTQFSISVSTNMAITTIGSVGEFICEDVGANFVDIGELNTIETTYSGWASVSNLQQGLTGQDEETDAQLRTRYTLGVFGLGAGTVPAIGANLVDDVLGVTSANVIENTTNSADSYGQPAHS
ncbi:MAG: hypothetical protein ACRYGR_10145, partial [Janthinobacterium lividum]